MALLPQRPCRRYCPRCQPKLARCRSRCRLFFLSLLLRILPCSGASTAIALLVSSLLFGALHAPAFVLLFGGLNSVPPLAWLWLILLNGFMGMAFGWMFLRSGIGAAIIAHFATDFVWHVASQLA